jgi:hypothetical protein
MLRKVLPIVVFLFVFLVSAIPTLAQETPPEHPDGPAVTVPPEIQATTAAESQARYEEFLSRSILNFRVAYLISQDEENTESLLSGNNIYNVTGAVLVGSWEEFLQLNEEQPFHIVLLHASMLDEIDMEWTRNAYRNRVILVGMNIDLPEMVEITGDVCMGKRHETNFVDQEFYVYLTYVASAEIPEELELLHRATLETCTRISKLRGTGGVTHGAGASFVEQPSDIEGLVNGLVVETMNYGISKQINNEIIPLPEN